MTIFIILPSVDEDPVSDMLRVITKALVEKTGRWVGNILGGEFGYGLEWNSEVFQMHPYCWCEKWETCPWCYGCSCGNQVFFTTKKENPKVTCDWCENTHKYVEQGAIPPAENPHAGAPHFWHKSSGMKIWWYKYIGRSMTCVNVPFDLSPILNECLTNIANTQLESK